MAFLQGESKHCLLLSTPLSLCLFTFLALPSLPVLISTTVLPQPVISQFIWTPDWHFPVARTATNTRVGASCPSQPCLDTTQWLQGSLKIQCLCKADKRLPSLPVNPVLPRPPTSPIAKSVGCHTISTPECGNPTSPWPYLGSPCFTVFFLSGKILFCRWSFHQPRPASGPLLLTHAYFAFPPLP